MSPTLAVSVSPHLLDQVEAGKALCRCWKSKTFPYCDGSHAKHGNFDIILDHFSHIFSHIPPHTRRVLCFA